MGIHLGHLAVFHAVAEEKSVTRGADRLLVSQPAVSKQLRILEKSLGMTLMERTPRGIRLTESGEILAAYARRIFALEAEAIEALKELHGLARGRLRIGASTTLGVYLLPEVFVQFRRHHPAIDATLEVANSRGVQNRLVEGSLDVGFTESPSDHQAVKCTHFMSDELVPIASPAHPLASKRRVSANMFCQEPFIVRAMGSDTTSFVERALAQRGLTVNQVMSLATTEAIKCAVAAGIGVAIVSKLSLGLELKARTLAIVPVTGLTIRRPLFRLERIGTPTSHALAAFLGLLLSVAQ